MGVPCHSRSGKIFHNSRWTAPNINDFYLARYWNTSISPQAALSAYSSIRVCGFLWTWYWTSGFIEAERLQDGFCFMHLMNMRVKLSLSLFCRPKRGTFDNIAPWWIFDANEAARIKRQVLERNRENTMLCLSLNIIKLSKSTMRWIRQVAGIGRWTTKKFCLKTRREEKNMRYLEEWTTVKRNLDEYHMWVWTTFIWIITGCSGGCQTKSVTHIRPKTCSLPREYCAVANCIQKHIGV